MFPGVLQQFSPPPCKYFPGLTKPLHLFKCARADISGGQHCSLYLFIHDMNEILCSFGKSNTLTAGWTKVQIEANTKKAASYSTYFIKKKKVQVWDCYVKKVLAPFWFSFYSIIWFCQFSFFFQPTNGEVSVMSVLSAESVWNVSG